jgi:hypothetical protein
MFYHWDTLYFIAQLNNVWKYIWVWGFHSSGDVLQTNTQLTQQTTDVLYLGTNPENAECVFIHLDKSAKVIFTLVLSTKASELGCEESLVRGSWTSSSYCTLISHPPKKLLQHKLIYHWRMTSSGMLRRVDLVRTKVSEELSASIIRVTRIGELGVLAITRNRRTLRINTFVFVAFVVHQFLSPWWWRRYVPLKRQFLQEPQGITSQKTPFFIVTAVETSNLT